jgi:hypothetical protein
MFNGGSGRHGSRLLQKLPRPCHGRQSDGSRIMTQPIKSETIEYERYLDGLRGSNEELLECLKDLRAKIKRGSVLKNEKVYFTAEDFDRINAVIAKAEDIGLPAPAKTITVHVEGRLIQDANGIPLYEGTANA